MTAEAKTLLQELYDAARDRYMVAYQVTKDFDFDRLDDSSGFETNLVGDLLEHSVLAAIEWFIWEAIESGKYLCPWLSTQDSSSAAELDFSDYLNDTSDWDESPADTTNFGELPVLDWRNLLNYLVNDSGVVFDKDSSGTPTALAFLENISEDSRGYVDAGYAIPGHKATSRHRFGLWTVGGSGTTIDANDAMGLILDDLEPREDAFLRTQPTSTETQSTHQYYYGDVRPTITYIPAVGETPSYPFTVTLKAANFSGRALDMTARPTELEQSTIALPTTYIATIAAANTPVELFDDDADSSAAEGVSLVGYSWDVFGDPNPFNTIPAYDGEYLIEWSIERKQIQRGKPHEDSGDLVIPDTEVKTFFSGYFAHPQELVDWMDFWYYVLNQLYITHSNEPDDGLGDLSFKDGAAGDYVHKQWDGATGQATEALAKSSAESATPTLDNIGGTSGSASNYLGIVRYQVNEEVGGGTFNADIDITGNNIPYHSDHDAVTNGITRTLQLYGRPWPLGNDASRYETILPTGWTVDLFQIIQQVTGATDGDYNELIDFADHTDTNYWPSGSPPGSNDFIAGGYQLGESAAGEIHVCGVAIWDFDELA